MSEQKQIYTASNLSDLFYFLQSVKNIKIISGCTQIKTLPEKSVSVRNIKELKFIRKHETRCDFGPETTLSMILDMDPSKLPQVFYEAVKSVGTANIKNMATIAGNICAKDWRHTLFAPLLALDAKIEIQSQTETAFVTMSQLDNIPEDFVITKIQIPLEEWEVSIFRRLGPSNVISENSAGFVFLANSIKGQIANLRISFAGPFYIRSKELENKLLGAHLPLSENQIKEMVEQAEFEYETSRGDKEVHPMLKAQFLNLVKSSLEQLT